jgi:Ran GTPase-activating protein (RanGAP) involved in mRNA processing and transport
LTSVNLLGNDIGEAAADIVRAAEQHGKIQTLCGIKPDQKEVSFENQRLKSADAVLLAYDIKFNAPLKTLNLQSNEIGIEGAKALAAVLPRCVQLQNGMRSAPSDASN